MPEGIFIVLRKKVLGVKSKRLGWKDDDVCQIGMSLIYGLWSPLGKRIETCQGEEDKDLANCTAEGKLEDEGKYFWLQVQRPTTSNGNSDGNNFAHSYRWVDLDSHKKNRGAETYNFLGNHKRRGPPAWSGMEQMCRRKDGWIYLK